MRDRRRQLRPSKGRFAAHLRAAEDVPALAPSFARDRKVGTQLLGSDAVAALREVTAMRQAPFGLRQLRILKTIVDLGSLTRAGQRLALSQPAISQHVRTLEERLGLRLLARTGRGVRPTPAGEVLVRYASEIIVKVDAACREIGAHRKGLAGALRIGVDPQSNSLLPPVLVALKSCASSLEVRVTSEYPAALLKLIVAGEIDLGLLPVPVDAGRLRVVSLATAALRAIMRPDHPLAGREWIGPRDLESHPLVLYDRRSPITGLTLEFLFHEGVFPRIAIEIDDVEAVKESVQLGIGVAVVPEWCARREIAAGLLRGVRLGAEGDGLSCSWGLVYEEAQPLPATLRAAVAVCSALLPKLLIAGA